MRFLHLSDIHFKHSEVGEPDDPNRALRNDMIGDVEYMRGRLGDANGVLISGDVAYAGLQEEYEFARNWLETVLCPAAGCPIQNVFVIPGNHDVDWSAQAGPAQVIARRTLRGLPANRVDDEIRGWLRDKASADVIFGPIDNYNRFAAKYLCEMGPYRGEDQPASRPFATRDLYLNDGSTLRLWGFNSVLVSNREDGPDTMLVDPAASQIEEQEGVTHVVLCHHPLNWIKNRQSFEDRLNRVAKLQLFGHEHTKRVDEARRYVRVRAGAVQPARDDAEWKPGYNWIQLDVEGVERQRFLNVNIWVRMYEVSQFLAMPNPEREEVWSSRISLRDWKAPAVASAEIIPSRADRRPMSEPPEPIADIRSVTFKMFKLNEHEQRQVIVNLSLDEEGDRDMKDYEVAIAAVKRASEQSRLDQLDKEIDAILDQG